jgi:hypothetical protein
MREKAEILWPCPISKSSNRDEYNDICKATGKQCPYYIDEGMSVCKSKAKCLAYFSKRLSEVKLKQVVKLILSDTQPKHAMLSPNPMTIKSKVESHTEDPAKPSKTASEFLEGLEDALKCHEEKTVEAANIENPQLNFEMEEQVAVVEEPKKILSSSEFLEGLEDALRNHAGSIEEDEQDEVSVDEQIVAIEESMKKM